MPTPSRATQGLNSNIIFNPYEHARELLRASQRGDNGIAYTPTYIDTRDVFSTSETKQAKEDYIKNLSFDDAEKVHGWIRGGDNDTGRRYITNTRIWGKEKNQRLLLLDYNYLDDNHSLEEFKDQLRVVNIKFKSFENAKFSGGAITFSISDIYGSDGMPQYEYVGSDIGNLVWMKDSHDHSREVLHDVTGKPSTVFCSCSLDFGEGTTPQTLTSEVAIVYHDNVNEMLKDINYAIVTAKRKIVAQLETILERSRFRTRKVHVASRKHRSTKRGRYITHDIPFSCEIECYGKNEPVVGRVAHELGKEIGFTHDGSLTSGIGYPVELQTPVLLGKRGEICIANICEKLSSNGFKIDKTCGLHIHLDGGKFGLRSDLLLTGEKRPSELISLYLFYRLFDDVIISFLPSTRRNNRYCASMASYSEYHDVGVTPLPIDDAFKTVRKFRTLQDFEIYWYKLKSYDYVMREKQNRYTPTRYYGANFHSLLKDNHFEIRYHSGTLISEKILCWINLHGNIMQKCVDGTINEEWLDKIRKKNMGIKEKTEIMYAILGLNEEDINYFNGRQQSFEGQAPTDEIMIIKGDKKESY